MRITEDHSSKLSHLPPEDNANFMTRFTRVILSEGAKSRRSLIYEIDFAFAHFSTSYVNH